MASLMNFLRESLAKVIDLPTYNYLSLTLCKTLFIYIGFWPAESKPKRIVADVRRCLPPSLLFINLYTGFIGYPMLLYHTIGVDLQRCLTAAAGVFVCFTLFAVYTSLLFQRPQIDRIFRAMEAMNVCSSKLSKRPADVVERNRRWSLVPFGYLVLCLVAVPAFYADLPGVYAKRELPYDQWYPIEEKLFPVYQILFVFTTISHNCALVAMVSFTAMFMSLIVEAIGHFRLLSHNFRNIVAAGQVVTVKSSDCSNPPQDEEEPRAKRLPNVGKTPAIQTFAEGTRKSDPRTNQTRLNTLAIQIRTDCLLGDSLVVRLEGKLEQALKTCVQHHYAIIRFVEEVACLFDRFLTGYLLCTLVPTSMAIVLLIYAEELDEKTMTILVLVTGSNLGMAIICWLANHMTDESEGVRDAVYDCDWFGQSESFKKNMRIILSRCNQPVAVKVGGLVTLSMETFYEMSKLTYSYSMAVWTQYQEAAKR